MNKGINIPAFVLIAAAIFVAFAAFGTSPVIKGATPFFDQVAYNGIATGSLPSCASGVAAGEGWSAYDSTTKTVKFCNGTSWTTIGPDLTAVTGNIIPSSDLSQNVGSGTKTWNALYTLTLNDSADLVRLNIQELQTSIYTGNGSDGVGALAHRFINGATITASDTRYAAKFYRDNNTNATQYLDTNGNFRNGTSRFAAPMVHGTSDTTAKDIEVGSGAMTASELAVTFSTAFGTAPVCNCTHVNTTNTNACNIKTSAVPTTSGVTFAVASGGTDVVHWQCIGSR